MAYKAVVIGASGLIGSKLLNILLQWPGYTEVVSLGRKKLHIKHDMLTQINVDFENLEEYTEYIQGHAVFCCLGTTRKETPDLNKYRHIDHDYPLEIATIAKRNGVEQFHLVSSIGANKNSASFYTRIKGETEEDIKAVGINCLHIYEPSVLTGYRGDRRVSESIIIKIMAFINPLLFGRLKKYKSIKAYTVAMAMFKTSLKNMDGVFIHPSDEIKQIA